MRGAIYGGFGKRFAPDSTRPAQNPAAATAWELERKIARLRWVVLVLCLCSLPLWSTTDRLLVAGTCLVLGLGNWKLLTLLRRQPEIEHLNSCQRLATITDWVSGLAMIAALDPLTPLSFLGPLIALVLITQLRFGRNGLRLAVICSASIIAARTALDVTARENPVMLPAERLAIALVTLAGLYYLFDLLDTLRVEVAPTSASEDTQAILEPETSTTFMKLTRRHRELLPLLARDDLTYRDIARELNISPETVRSHVKRLIEALDLDRGGRLAIVRFAETHGLLDDPGPPAASAMDSSTDDQPAENAPQMHPKKSRNAPD